MNAPKATAKITIELDGKPVPVHLEAVSFEELATGIGIIIDLNKVLALQRVIEEAQIPYFWSERIEVLPFSLQTYTRLKEAKINTVGDLLRKSESELLGMSNLRQRYVKEIKAVLEHSHLALSTLTPA